MPVLLYHHSMRSGCRKKNKNQRNFAYGLRQKKVIPKDFYAISQQIFGISMRNFANIFSHPLHA